MWASDVVALLIVILLPTALLGYMARRFFTLREKQLEAQSSLAAEKAAQYAAHVERLETRLRVLEEIATDGGAQTAAQIEALRASPRLEIGEKVR